MIPWWTGGEAAVSEQKLAWFTGYTVITVVSTAWRTFHVALNTLLLALVYIVTTRTRGHTRLIWWMTKIMCTRHYIMHVWLMHNTAFPLVFFSHAVVSQLFNKLKNFSCARLLYNKCYYCSVFKKKYTSFIWKWNVVCRWALTEQEVFGVAAEALLFVCARALETALVTGLALAVLIGECVQRAATEVVAVPVHILHHVVSAGEAGGRMRTWARLAGLVTL